jgi:sensor c-di-GMP phosphodiesterase-like protein
MKRRTATVLTVLGAVLALATPTLLGLALSHRQALETTTQRALALAHDALRRAEQTSDQLEAGISRLNALGTDNPCSPAHIEAMRQIDLAFGYIQAIGHVHDEHLVCSSISGPVDGYRLDLGPVDHVTARGAQIRNDVRLPFAPGESFVVVERDGFAAILNKNQTVDVAGLGADSAIGVFTLGNRRIVTERGNIEPRWIDALADQAQVTFVDDGHLVALARSERYLIAAVAAIPNSEIGRQTRAAALWLVPIGVLAGLLLAAAVFQLMRSQQQLPAVIRGALRREEFFLVYQPIVALDSGTVVGAEALLRWRDREGKLVPPDVFIPVAVQSGQITRLTRHVMGLLTRDLEGVFQRHPDFRVSLNLAAQDLCDPRTPAALSRLQEATQARPGNLVVEVTEHSLLETQLAQQTIGRMRQQGIPVAIDDFGTGYSSLSVLQSLQVDFIKIDRSFVETVATGAVISEVVPHIIDMGKSLGLRMIAEGVETSDQADYLRQRGVQFAQGWLFGRPVVIDELVSRIGTRCRA